MDHPSSANPPPAHAGTHGRSTTAATTTPPPAHAGTHGGSTTPEATTSPPRSNPDRSMDPSSANPPPAHAGTHGGSTTAAATPPPPPPMVLVDRDVIYVDELNEIIKETGGLTLDRSIESALKRPTECSSSGLMDFGTQQQMVIQDEIRRYLEEVEEPAFALLRARKASRPSAVRKEPLPEAMDGDGSHYRVLLDGIEPCFPPVADAPPSVTCMSLKIAWPPRHLLSGYHSPAVIVSCHCCFLVLYLGTYHPWFQEPGFYLVNNALSNSVAIVPPLFLDYMSHCDIGSAAVLCCSIDEGEYILAELFLCRDVQTTLLTNKATLFIWASSSQQWDEREVVLPLPPAPVDDDETDTTSGTCSFHADMAFAVSFSSICWVDLLTGILVYNHIPSKQFHFIPLPEQCVTSFLRAKQGQRRPEEYRSMCCVDRQTVKFVAMDESYSQECPILTTWTLRRPLSPTNWKWEKDAVSSFCMKDLWEDQVYKDKLLRPMGPRCPVISTQEPDIIYLSVTDYEDNDLHYVLSLNMDRCRIESVYKVPYAISPRPRLFASDFSRYLKKTREWDARDDLDMGPRMMHEARDDLDMGPRRKEKIADEVESRSKPLDLGILKLSRCVIPTPGGRSNRTCPVGLQAVLDVAIG